MKHLAIFFITLLFYNTSMQASMVENHESFDGVIDCTKKSPDTPIFQEEVLTILFLNRPLSLYQHSENKHLIGLQHCQRWATEDSSTFQPQEEPYPANSSYRCQELINFCHFKYVSLCQKMALHNNHYSQFIYNSTANFIPRCYQQITACCKAAYNKTPSIQKVGKPIAHLRNYLENWGDNYMAESNEQDLPDNCNNSSSTSASSVEEYQATEMINQKFEDFEPSSNTSQDENGQPSYVSQPSRHSPTFGIATATAITIGGAYYLYNYFFNNNESSVTI